MIQRALPVPISDTTGLVLTPPSDRLYSADGAFAPFLHPVASELAPPKTMLTNHARHTRTLGGNRNPSPHAARHAFSVAMDARTQDRISP